MPRKVRIKDPKEHVEEDTEKKINKIISNTDRDITTLDLDLKASKEGEKYAMWKDEGIYSCAGCSAPLFTSHDKLESSKKTNKPSFRSLISPSSVSFAEDYTYGMCRVVTICAQCGKILGHTYNKNTNQEIHIVYSHSVSFKARGEKIKKIFGVAVIVSIVAIIVGYKLLKK